MHTRRVCANQRETVMSGEKMAAVETPQDEIEQLREDLAEHATHLDLLQQNADSQRTNWAADRMRLNALAQEVKELRENAAADRLLIRNNAEQVKAAAENTGAVLADIMGRLETLEVKDIQRSADPATANKAADRLAQSSKDLWRKVWKIEEAIDAMKYRRMVGNMFRRVADLVDGG